MGKPIIIEDYNPNWIVKFEEEKRHLKAIMKDKAIAIEHVGSTSVKGLGAKEIIDIMIGVQHLKDVEKFIEPLKDIGYEHISHAQFPNRRFFRKGLWRAGTHHLHVYKYGSKEWTSNLLFRDYLRTHPLALQEYQQLKRSLAEKHPFDRMAYTEAKAPFITDTIKKAENDKNNL
ncbi:hypothetical protein BTA37_28380 [Priestia megaterium]|jgi:GrpB-like predicted nucleotidyltransferase (UPF0157 family)|uniref:GrpB family protein n=1 Tax=Priestia megaterium TaxID=1404 RepID=UPI00094D21D0|nr:GrpB family protein [Priestia megaterium]MBT2258438.1 GrpB family protein [Priestia megaterium]MBT2281810.1 GrpB family protein [Priestia megaterium]OLO26220.1 hypothetical protein BTA37_28380 [Priestia megaterium]